MMVYDNYLWEYDKCDKDLIEELPTWFKPTFTRADGSNIS